MRHNRPKGQEETMGLATFLSAANEYASAQKELRKATEAAVTNLSAETAEDYDLCEAFAEKAKDDLEAAFDKLSDEAAAVVRAQFGETCSVTEWAEKVF